MNPQIKNDISTLDTRKPLPDGLEERAAAWVAAWKSKAFKAMDAHLIGLNVQQQSVVVRRGQRLATA